MGLRLGNTIGQLHFLLIFLGKLAEINKNKLHAGVLNFVALEVLRNSMHSMREIEQSCFLFYFLSINFFSFFVF
jgi:hypothetical protein